MMRPGKKHISFTNNQTTYMKRSGYKSDLFCILIYCISAVYEGK
jgi:hypothetical protein